MKLQYKLGILFWGLIAFTSCVEDEPYDDNNEIEKPTTNCNWNVSSTTCKAGDTFSFKGTYSSENEHSFSHNEVCYDVYRTDEAFAIAKLAGPNFNFTQNYYNEALVLNQLTFKFDHSLANWNGQTFELIDSVPVSSTLIPISWNGAKEWNQKKYETYFPKGFAETFEKSVDSLIVTDVNYNALRYLYINYAFSNERFAEINAQFDTDFPTDIAYDESDARAGATDKSTRWIDYNNPKVSFKAAPVVGYYYQTIVDGEVLYHEVAIAEVEQNAEGANVLIASPEIRVYEVYESAPWVFSRYSDDLGSVVITVRPQYIAAFKALVEPITFQEWIHGNDGYAIAFKRNYKLDASFRVYELDGSINVAENSYIIDIY